MFRLPEVAKLPAVSGGDDEGWPASEAVIIDEHNGRIVVGALLLDLYIGDGDGGGSGGGSKLHFVFYFSPLTCGGWVWCHC